MLNKAKAAKTINMKNLFLFLTTLLVLVSCKPKEVLAPVVQEEFRDLDTMVISAPRPEPQAEVNMELDPYNPSATREHDLLHTKLDLRFNWEQEQVIGVAEVKLKAMFYPKRYVALDAKNFEFNKVQFANSNTPLKYDYDGKKITIDLGREYTRKEEFTLLIDYVASPSSEGGSAAITSDKGLFFINPRGEEGDKPQQIWTQGETEHNSRWFPTIDKPNERCTQEMYLTVQDKFKTLSNGLLVSSNKNADGTRTDYWNMDLPHAPYLFMIAVGEFAVVEDRWEGMLVDYYVEEEYEPYARRIYPHTPEMLGFFSDILQVKYPWQKYSQVTVRDYVSGAMENTTGVIFGEFMQGTERELIDNLTNDKIVAHEMFHHWFGDLVTCESWANLTLNEGFANYSEYLWLEHKYGKDEADYHKMSEFEGYMGSAMQQGIHPLIHYGYDDKEDMFDAHSYNKGGLVLHSLRSYMGDEAFFAGLEKYLNDHKYSAVEVDELRMAFEDISGEDMHWFFDQWYLNQGQPNLNVFTEYNPETKKVELLVEQTQDPAQMPAVFQMSVKVDVYTDANTKESHTIFINQREQTFTLDAATKPAFVDFDADKSQLAVTNYEKSEEEYIFQYYHTPSLENRIEALVNLNESESAAAKKVIADALNDKFWAVRANAANACDLTAETEATIAKLLATDPHSQVRGTAAVRLGETGKVEYAPVLKNAIQKDQSYDVIGRGNERSARA